MDVETQEGAKWKSIEVFCCYAHEDQPLLFNLKTHLKPLQREGLISLWADVDINAGTEWEKEIDCHLHTARIILLLISPDFMASEYCYSVEMQQAMERHERGEARVIPIILRPVDWKGTPFAKLQVLPAGGKPVTKWPNHDDAFLDVVQGIRDALKALAIKNPAQQEKRFPIPLGQPSQHLPEGRPARQIILLVVSVLLVIAGGSSAGFFIIRNNQIASDNIHATATAHTSATQTAATGVDVRANGVYAQGIPLVYDRLNVNSPSKWSENRDPQGNWGCQFQDGAYHVYQKLQENVVTCVAEGTDLPDYTYEVTMSLLKGDSGGILFRVNSPKGMYLYYYFLIIPNGGKYQFGLFNGKFQPLQSDFSPAILTGLQQHNVLAVHVNKDNITLYVNYQKIYSVKDTSYSHGAVGVFVYEHSSSTEAVFSDARIWTP